MSFSSEVKQELAKQSGKSRHCQIAELAALVAFDGKRQQLIGDAGDVLDSENPLLQEKYGLLLAQLFHVNIEEIDTLPPERILETIKMWNQSLRCADITETVNGILLQPLPSHSPGLQELHFLYCSQQYSQCRVLFHSYLKLLFPKM